MRADGIEKGGEISRILMFPCKFRKHTIGLFIPTLPLPPLAFVASSFPNDKVHAIATNAVVSTAADKAKPEALS